MLLLSAQACVARRLRSPLANRELQEANPGVNDNADSSTSTSNASPRALTSDYDNWKQAQALKQAAAAGQRTANNPNTTFTLNDWLGRYNQSISTSSATTAGVSPAAIAQLSLEVLVAKGADPPRLLMKCEGDCDHDSECEANLLCFMRAASEEVPGCVGDKFPSRNTIDFCYDPADGSGPTFRSVASPPAASPTSSFSAPTNSPQGFGSAGNQSPGSNTLVSVGSNTQGLGRCEGDCNSDADCSGNLICYFRQGALTSVPGCIGTGTMGQNYCIDALDNPSGFNEDTFRLKLFWRQGYFWQEESFERLWCMQCQSFGCAEGDRIRIYECSASNTEFQFINQNGDETQVQIANTNFCLQADPINVVGEENHYAVVKQCDDSDINQRFKAGVGNFNGIRFEFQPVQLTGCLTQRHHPRSGEEIYTELCETTRADTTNFWNKY